MNKMIERSALKSGLLITDMHYQNSNAVLWISLKYQEPASELESYGLCSVDF